MISPARSSFPAGEGCLPVSGQAGGRLCPESSTRPRLCVADRCSFPNEAIAYKAAGERRPLRGFQGFHPGLQAAIWRNASRFQRAALGKPNHVKPPTGCLAAVAAPQSRPAARAAQKRGAPPPEPSGEALPAQQRPLPPLGGPGRRPEEERRWQAGDRPSGAAMAFCRFFGGEIYQSHFEPGIYICSKCGYELFSSQSKFLHSSPWPAFTHPIHSDSISKYLERPGAFKVSCGNSLTFVHKDQSGKNMEK
ncbi:methionine-R-sulfoxide reductase B1 [Crotalus adamanteus]|uniref:Methionine-R-sulfoxide reductase B1 n=1 Tax=Crotalus adamanteus TaxID=8729 RepID=A0AAW1AVB0_CROAD